jgi:hypothetical protein
VETLESYVVQEAHTVHMVKGPPPTGSAPSTAAPTPHTRWSLRKHLLCRRVVWAAACRWVARFADLRGMPMGGGMHHCTHNARTDRPGRRHTQARARARARARVLPATRAPAAARRRCRCHRAAHATGGARGGHATFQPGDGQFSAR